MREYNSKCPCCGEEGEKIPGPGNTVYSCTGKDCRVENFRVR